MTTIGFGHISSDSEEEGWGDGHDSTAPPNAEGLKNFIRKKPPGTERPGDRDRHAKKNPHEGDEGYVLRFHDPFVKYRRQLADTVFDRTTKASMWSLGQLAILYEQRKTVEDVMALVGLVGVVLALVLDEQMYRAHAGLVVYEEDTFEHAVKWLLLLDSVVLVALLWWAYSIYLRVDVIRNVVPHHTTIMTWKQRRRAFLTEFVVLFFHVPIGVDFVLDPAWGFGEMHVNYFNVFVIVRMYLFLRVMRNHSGFYDQQIHYIGSLQGVDTNAIVFNFRMLLKERPLWLLAPLYLLIIFSTAVAVCMFERIQEEPKITNYWEATWFTIITMSTVGYGDYYPISVVGKLVTVLGGVVGGTVLITMLVAVFCVFTEVTDREDYVINVVDKRKWAREMREISARCIQECYWQWHYLVKDRARRKRGRRLQGLRAGRRWRHLQGMYRCLQDKRELRRQKPPDMTYFEMREKSVLASREMLLLARGESYGTEHLQVMQGRDQEDERFSKDAEPAEDASLVRAVRGLIEKQASTTALVKELLEKVKEKGAGTQA
jgi:hypothetical protein